MSKNLYLGGQNEDRGDNSANEFQRDDLIFARGSLIGESYRILDVIGQGGMGFVYKVEHLMLAKVMALKVLHSNQCSSIIWQRFRDEAQAIARLNHENIVKIYDMSLTAEGFPYYTMDYLVGQSLAECLDLQGRLSLRDALLVFEQICAGLAYAHGHGIVHRDIKPGNIMILPGRDTQENPKVKIVDFGIAKLYALDGSSLQGLTRPGEVFGTPLYMSPEQCSGHPLDYRTDMYSLGVTMFQSLTGGAPLIGRSAAETAALHQTAIPPSLAQAAGNSQFPDSLEKLVAKLLAKHPLDRYHSLADTGADLRLIREQLKESEFKGDSERDESLFASEQSHSTKARTTSSQPAFQVPISTMQIILLLCLFLFCAAASVAFMLSVQRSADKLSRKSSNLLEEPPIATLLSNAVTSSAPGRVSYNPDGLDEDEVKEIVRFLNAKPGFFSQIDSRRQGTIYNFPTKFKIGTYKIFDSQDYKSTRTKDAVGVVFLPKGSLLKLEIDQAAKEFPQLLQSFRPNDLHSLTISLITPRSPDLAKNVQRLTGLRFLSLVSQDFSSKDLNWIEKLPHLQTLYMSAARLEASEMMKHPGVLRLKGLGISGMKKITPVLEALVKQNSITDLDVSRVELSSADEELIAQMKNLRRLWLRETGVTDASLEKYSKLTHLQILNLEGCTKLTSKSVGILKRLKHLEDLSLPLQIDSEKDEADLKRALPRLRIYN